jgi:hypothetical protein
MEHVIKALAQAWHLNPAQYWHLRMLSAVMLVPLLGVLYLAVRFFRNRS